MSQFTDFLRWARVYRDEHGGNALRSTWSSINRTVSHTEFCSCGKALISSTSSTRRLLLTREQGLACRNCGNCDNCCDCFYCESCNNYRDSDNGCRHCERCRDNCCSCVFCNNCNEECSENSGCGECSNCGDCCDCKKHHNIEFFHNGPYFHKASKLEHKFNQTDRFISVEIEISDLSDDGYPIVRTVRKWHGSIVEDGSLPDSGFEINTAPASGDLFVKQVTEICKALNTSGAEVNTRCGLHVHIDARDYNYYDICKLVNLYAAIEPALFAMVPTSRKNSTYCVPCGGKYVDILHRGIMPYKDLKGKIVNQAKKQVILATYDSSSTKNMRTEKYNSARYNALNIHSWFYRGTIECRMFNGTTNADKIINWGILWSMILDCAARADMRTKFNSVNPIVALFAIIGNNTKIRDFAIERIRTHNNNPEISRQLDHYLQLTLDKVA